MTGFPDLPPIWAAATAVVAILAGKFVPILGFPTSKALSTVLVLLGFSLIICSAYYFFKKKTSIEPHHTPSSLIVEGPFRISRNPIYLGMLIGLLGLATWSGALSSLLLVFIFPLVINRRFIAQEEEVLRREFGDEADAYLNSTSRWIFGF